MTHLSILPVLPTGTPVQLGTPIDIAVGWPAFSSVFSLLSVFVTLGVCLHTCEPLCGSCKTIINTHTNNPSDARKRVTTIPAPGGMCEPWCAAYLVSCTLLLVLALGLGEELAQTAKVPLHYASVSGGGPFDQSLPPKVWGARIVPRSNTVEGNAPMLGQDNFCHRSKHAQDLLHFKAMVTSIPPGTQDDSSSWKGLPGWTTLSCWDSFAKEQLTVKGCKNSMAPTATEWQHAEPAAVTPTYCTRILCIAASPRQKGGGRCASASTWENSAAHSGWQLKDTAGRIFGRTPGVSPPSTMGASAMANLPADVLSAAVGKDLHWLRQLLACSYDEECPWGSPLLTSTLTVCDQTVLEECPQGNLLDKFHTAGWSGTAASSSNSSAEPLGYWTIACERTGAVTSSLTVCDQTVLGMPPG